MADKGMVTRQDTSLAREGVRVPDTYVRPAVDIYETEENLTLVADLPGVAKEDLDINLERGILTIRGGVKGGAPGKALFREFTLGEYFRQFQLPDEIDADKTSAELKKGVLTLTLAKSAAAKPRRIEIKH
ncbi:Hsp20/alpha crystallin family protein [Geoalkalibacter sp.]|uniref:Hsp20/alpha crystallin family protein n=1 Tax=Geoalkalibacter sp. TaxID=3041440 RepID=UPI00272E9D05|nr:Hsp20/alpha crystallin family protein [Geoalkalibacter sp.]